MVIKIIHGIYTGDHLMEEAKEFEDYIMEKFEKFKRKYDLKFLYFSIGITEDKKIKVIATVHAWDVFDVNIARQIILGRITRMRGHLKWVDNDGQSHRDPYDPIPKFIEVVT